MALIRARQISLAYRGQRLLIEGLDLELLPGERMGLTGRSGLGKSTLLNAILQAGVGRLSETVRKGTLEVNTGPIGYAPQRDAIPEWFSVRTMRDRLTARAPKTRRELLRSIFTDFGLDSLEDSYPRELSGGERQRLNVALALTLAGDLIALDEPLTDLDPATKAEVLQKVSGFLGETGAALILVSHDLDILLRLSDRICVLGSAGVLDTVATDSLSSQQLVAEKRNELLAKLAGAAYALSES